MLFDLSTWGNGVPRLYHEDSLHGRDVVIVLEEDGAYVSFYVVEEEEERRILIQLDAFLRQLLEEREE